MLFSQAEKLSALVQLIDEVDPVAVAECKKRIEYTLNEATLTKDSKEESLSILRQVVIFQLIWGVTEDFRGVDLPETIQQVVYGVKRLLDINDKLESNKLDGMK